MKIKNLKKSYGSLSVYDNFNLEIEEGKITCILGESGSGKTTLLNCIARITDFEGEIDEVKCSYVFQTTRLVPNLTVKENVALVCKDEKRTEEVLRSVKLEDKADEYPKNLSGGQAQRVSLARALAFGQDVMLLDEPFCSLDLKLKLEIYDLLKSLQKKFSVTCLLVTHEVEEALNLSDRILVLKGGKILLDVATDETDKEKMRGILISALVGA